jgi:hypothetical protein
MAEIIEVNDPSKFEATFQEVASQQDFVVLVFTGATDATSGKSWCPDCVVHKDAITEKVLK